MNGCPSDTTHRVRRKPSLRSYASPAWDPIGVRLYGFLVPCAYYAGFGTGSTSRDEGLFRYHCRGKRGQLPNAPAKGLFAMTKSCPDYRVEFSPAGNRYSRAIQLCVRPAIVRALVWASWKSRRKTHPRHQDRRWPRRSGSSRVNQISGTVKEILRPEICLRATSRFRRLFVPGGGRWREDPERVRIVIAAAERLQYQC
jgi:hypothetical protein